MSNVPYVRVKICSKYTALYMKTKVSFGIILHENPITKMYKLLLSRTRYLEVLRGKTQLLNLYYLLQFKN